MTKLNYNIKLDIPQDADSVRYFIPEGYTARIEDGVLIIEPKESEGEKIRKEIVSFIRAFRVDHRDSVPQTSKWLDWLEKQKDSPMPEDTVIFQKGVAEGRRLEREEQKPEWSEEDEICLQDALWCVKQASKIARGENDMGACWSAERWLNSLKNRGNSLKSNTNSLSKWSDKDEAMLAHIIFLVNGNMGEDETIMWLRERFKTLATCSRWKPSAEQMEALNALNCNGCLSYVGQQDDLISLYNDLKKLM